MGDDPSGDNRFRPASALCAIFVAAGGATSFAGWISGLTSLAGMAPGWIAMAPSTALLFVLFAAAILIRLYLHRNRRAMLAATLMVSACGAMGLLLFTLSSLGIHPLWEHLGISISGAVGTAPLGHMSPFTALCFVISAISFLASDSLSRISRRRAISVWWLTSLLITVNVLFLLSYIYGSPLLYGGPFIPPAITTLIAFLLQGVALLGVSAAGSPPLLTLNGTARSAERLLLSIFVLLTCGIVIAGYIYYSHFEQRHRDDAEKRLSAIADLKMNELVLWRKERLGDADVIHGNPAFSSLVKRFYSDPADRVTGDELRGWMSKLQAAYQYERISLLDARNTTRLAIPPVREQNDPHLSQYASRALRSGEVIFTDFHRHDPGSPIHLSILVPIFDPTDGNRPLGVLAFWIDPGRYLYPFIERWPVPSTSAETLLVRRDGDHVVFLNTPRFNRKAPLSIRLPLARTDLPAAKAVLGREGLVEGLDYRGIPVIAALRRVPGSPWRLVAKIDAEEIYAPLRERLWIVIALVAALLNGAAAGIGLLWRQQSAHHYKEMFRGERRYRTLVDTMTEGVALHEVVYDGAVPVDYRLITVNPAFARHTGIAVDEAEGKLASLLYGSGEAPFLKEYEHVARTGEPMAFDVFYPPLEKHFHVAVNSPAPGLFATIFEDVTERIRHEEELREKNQELERLNYTVSHDLKSPLVTIKTFLGYLAQDMAKGDAVRIEQDMMFMRTAAERMGCLLEDLFDLSRLGRTAWPPVDIAFSDLAREAVDLVAGRISQRGVEVAVADTQIMFQGDRPRLLQLWQNLIENAVKFMGDQAEPRIEVGVEPGTSKEPLFFVKDNGQGIDSRYREKIFGLFEQLDPGIEGTGIGLSLVKRIVELYGGRLWMESDGPGKGTTFYFTLPKAMKIQ